MKRFLLSIMLVSVLASTALGGDMPTVGAPAPTSSGMVDTAISPAALEDHSNEPSIQFCGGPVSGLLTVLGLLAL